MNTLSVILHQIVVGAVFFLPLWLMFECRRFAETPPDLRGLMAILQLSLVVSTLAFILFSYSVRQLGINRANMFTNMIPVFTALFAWLILGDVLYVLVLLRNMCKGDAHSCERGQLCEGFVKIYSGI